MRIYIVFLAFGATLNVIVIGEVFIIASLVGMIPLLPGGFGAVDGVMVGFYSKGGHITVPCSACYSDGKAHLILDGDNDRSCDIASLRLISP